jgi:hypothetical protein
MSWPTAPTAADVRSEFTPAESALLQRLQGDVDNLPAVVARAVAEVRDAIRSGGYDLGETGTLPLGLHADCIAIARWRWLLSLPGAGADLQTEVRERACKASLDKLKLIATQKYAVEPPTDPQASTAPAGRWNSENKLVGRGHPVPRPAVQFQPQAGRYSNPAAPEDQA